jgi:hypothetical protein
MDRIKLAIELIRIKPVFVGMRRNAGQHVQGAQYGYLL